MYGGSNEVFGKNENFPLVLDIKLHLKIPVNYQLQISPPPTNVLPRTCWLLQVQSDSETLCTDPHCVFLKACEGKYEKMKRRSVSWIIAAAANPLLPHSPSLR